MSGRSARVILVTALLSSAVTYALLRWTAPAPETEAGAAPPPTAVSASDAATGEPGPAFSADEEVNIRVYNRVSPGVVNITSTVVEFDFFFSPYAREGTGSGCVLDKEGHVLTNYHVIQGARNLQVSLPDQTKYRATLVGEDRQNDLAVIRMVDAPPERLFAIP
ncbi:MAG: peptidase S1, partial [Acidobacteria bacterium]|nr:peptidase S1 [Acidobacteriota bacterium]